MQCRHFNIYQTHRHNSLGLFTVSLGIFLRAIINTKRPFTEGFGHQITGEIICQLLYVFFSSSRNQEGGERGLASDLSWLLAARHYAIPYKSREVSQTYAMVRVAGVSFFLSSFLSLSLSRLLFLVPWTHRSLERTNVIFRHIYGFLNIFAPPSLDLCFGCWYTPGGKSFTGQLTLSGLSFNPFHHHINKH